MAESDNLIDVLSNNTTDLSASLATLRELCAKTQEIKFCITAALGKTLFTEVGLEHLSGKGSPKVTKVFSPLAFCLLSTWVMLLIP